MNTVGIMALGGQRRHHKIVKDKQRDFQIHKQFPFWEKCLVDLSTRVEALYLRFDTRTGDSEILKCLDRVCGPKLKDVKKSSAVWTPSNWREDLLRMLDGVKPQIVLFPDQDEHFDEYFSWELKEFVRSKRGGMMMSYHSPMPTDDGSVVEDGEPYPPKPHMKVFKWKPNLSYENYRGFARVHQYEESETWYMATRSKIWHYCYYTPSLRDLRKRQ